MALGFQSGAFQYGAFQQRSRIASGYLYGGIGWKLAEIRMEEMKREKEKRERLRRRKRKVALLLAKLLSDSED